MDGNAVVEYWQKYSRDVRYVEERERSKYDIGARRCEVGTIVYCRKFCDKIGLHPDEHKLKLIKECGPDPRHVCG